MVGGCGCGVVGQNQITNTDRETVTQHAAHLWRHWCPLFSATLPSGNTIVEQHDVVLTRKTLLGLTAR